MKAKVSIAKKEILGVEKIICNEARQLCEHKLPGLRGSIFQDMGEQPVRIDVFGSIFGEEAKDNHLSFIREQYLSAEPVIFISETVKDTQIEEMLIENFEVYESSDFHDTLKYRISLIEYIKPPEKIEAGMLEKDILSISEDRFDALVEDVELSSMDGLLSDFSDQFSDMDIDTLLDALPQDLLDKLGDLLGIGYENHSEVLKDTINDAISLDSDGINVADTVAGSAKIAAKLVMTILSASDDKKASWTNLAEKFKQLL